jgi:hypothetical protein
MSYRRYLKTVVLLLGLAPLCVAQPGSVQINEPGIYKLAKLFSHADKVALVEVVSGDTEAYDEPVYKARVIRGFKGVSTGTVLYFGRYLGVKLGSEYILFLKDATTAIKPKTKNAGYGVVSYSRVFDEGYSSMLTSYQCLFKGASPEQKCDYAVRVCTNFIVIPESLETGSESINPPFGCRWVKRDDFTSMLTSISGTIQ